jgi:transcriptional regulator with XRE-family HTH domain
MSQSDLAEALFISSNQYISRLESGKSVPSLELIIAMAELFHISTDALLTDGTLRDDKLTDSDVFSDCPPELRTIMLKITKTIKNILMEDYRK